MDESQNQSSKRPKIPGSTFPKRELPHFTKRKVPVAAETRFAATDSNELWNQSSCPLASNSIPVTTQADEDAFRPFARLPILARNSQVLCVEYSPNGVNTHEVVWDYTTSRDEKVATKPDVIGAGDANEESDADKPYASRRRAGSPIVKIEHSAQLELSGISLALHWNNILNDDAINRFINTKEARFGAHFATFMTLVAMIVQRFGETHYELIAAFPTSFARAMTSITPNLWKTHDYRSIADTFFSDLNALGVLSNRLPGNPMDVLRTRLANAACRSVPRWIWGKKSLRVVKILVDVQHLGAMHKSGPVFIVNGSGSNYDSDGKLRVSIEIGRTIDVSVLLTQFSTSLIVVKPQHEYGKFIRVVPGHMPENELVRVELLNSRDRRLVACVTYEIFNQWLRTITYHVSTACVADGHHMTHKTRVKLRGEMTPDTHDIPFEFSYTTADEMSAGIVQGFFSSFPKVVTDPFLQYQAREGGKPLKLQFSKNMDEPITLKQKLIAPFIIRFVTDNDFNKKHIKGGDIVAWSHGVTFQTNGNMAIALRASEFAYARSVMECDKGFNTYSFGFELQNNKRVADPDGEAANQ
ncbi:hypothetical protein M427DRAFT_59130 [Gonapodya prolifera JEL478]|uniref:Uncharacterized protein n=1 Tax=Gonapodya prolifera (strain JEL478) TaxID=1344416 RepID=A0A139A7M8_GONPJ|nr:hypothetical protein M427DRAFT_59130 [Gonapodya prolifera JEL478]|eukprot:KXS12806.1 hypothetical protein M427DRAFT_59130 [Gonapodya prolifera JEL478]